MKVHLKICWILFAMLTVNTVNASDLLVPIDKQSLLISYTVEESTTQEDFANFKTSQISVNQINHNAFTNGLLNNTKLNTTGIKLILNNNNINNQNTCYPQTNYDMQIMQNQDDFKNVKQPNTMIKKGINLYVMTTEHNQDAVFGKNLPLSATLQTTKANTFNTFNNPSQINLQQHTQNANATHMLSEQLFAGLEHQNNLNKTLMIKNFDTDIFITWLSNQTITLTCANINLNTLTNHQHQNTWHISEQIND